MNRRYIPCFFAILVTAMILLAGCSAKEEPVATPPPTTRTPTPEPTAVPTPTLSPACQDLLSSADADSAFMNAVSDNIIFIRVHSLAYQNCARGPASEISKNLADSPKPRTSVLSSARGSLLSAAGYCFEPEEGTAKSRTRDDFNRYIGKMGEYCDLVYSCADRFDTNTSSLLKKTIETQGCTLISGTGNKAQYLTVKREGLKVFSMTYTGSDDFSVSLTDPTRKKTDLHAKTTGPVTEVKQADLELGDHKIEIAASGPWTVSIFNP
jgi:hypothetical protein